MSDLRDLDADRRLVDFEGSISLEDIPKRINDLVEALSAALDEIDRLKRLLVQSDGKGGWYPVLHGFITPVFNTEADAWAAVRKAADGK